MNNVTEPEVKTGIASRIFAFRKINGNIIKILQKKHNHPLIYTT